MSDFLLSLLAFTLALSPLVFLHELGHYLMARACGVRVESFSIGFGPRLLGWTDKRGTQWQFSLFLLGGYVKMAGDENVASSVPSEKKSESLDTFHSKKPWQRILIAVAGPFANYLTAFVILCSLFVLVGKPDYKPVIGQVVADSAAASAGLKKGDRIIAIQDHPITHFSDLVAVLDKTQISQTLHVKIARETGEKEIALTSPVKKGMWKGQLGVVPEPSFRLFSPMTFSQAFDSIVEMMNPIHMVKSIKVEVLGGPISIGHQAGAVLKEGVVSFLFFMGMISLTLGFLNLLPIPLLDGGMILFCLIEMVTGKPLPVRVQKIVSFVAFLVLGGLFIFLSWKDLLRIPKVYELIKWVGLAS